MDKYSAELDNMSKEISLLACYGAARRWTIVASRSTGRSLVVPFTAAGEMFLRMNADSINTYLSIIEMLIVVNVGVLWVGREHDSSPR